MFENYFVRSSYEIIQTDFELYLDLGVRPEIYINSETLEKISMEEAASFYGVIKKFKSHTIHAPFLDISPGGFDQEIRRISFLKLEKILKIASLWKTRLVVMHFNYDPVYYREYFEKWLTNASTFFSGLLSKEISPQVALENVFEPTPYVVLKLMERINNKNLIHCFDFGHHHVFGNISIEEWLFYLKPRKHIHFHIHDNFGVNDDHLPVGDGDINWRKIKGILQNLKVGFSITLEPHTKRDLFRTIDNYGKIFLNETIE